MPPCEQKSASGIPTLPLAGRIAIITGSCGDGIGRSTALMLGRLGCGVVLNYGTHRDGPVMADRAQRVADVIHELGGKAVICRADTRDQVQTESLVRCALALGGRLDFLVLNGGGDWQVNDVSRISPEHWRSTLAAEVDGVFLLLRCALPHLRKAGSGRIVLLGLNGAAKLDETEGMALDYCLGRASRAWLATALARQDYAAGVRINIVEPGYVPGLGFSRAVELVRSESFTLFPPPAPLTCHHVARLVVLLCGAVGDHMSGSSLRIPTDILPVDRKDPV
ncbi:MAG: SDR family NAD(P)-dependent oxidoreductase [Solidesulfovibrio sp. DCME]|uniref:SDR family NAD(P)-dependent oxidoreductase n=1 Tax=Solidesulfovibrio sp. DCME TaxID=3447380 RepID=UPI003D0A88FD